MKFMAWLFSFLFSMTLSIFSLTPAFGQWATQTISLRPGWNATFVEVQPEPDACDVVFQGLPVESAWTWNRRFSTVQFIQKLEELVPEQPEWLTYFPPGSGKSFLTDLFTVQGGRGYLIKLGGSESVDWTVTGRPVVRSVDWMPNSFNLVGFHVAQDEPPTFQSFFAPSPSHVGQPVYRLSGSGEWEVIADPSAESIHSGEAYWIYCKGQSDYSGPIRVVFEQGDQMDFGRTLTEQTLRLRNETSSVKQIAIEKLASENPPDASLPSLAGGVPLTYWDWNSAAPDWKAFEAQILRSLQPGEEVALRMGVKRRDMADVPGSLYQSLLEVSDGEGSRLLLPVVSKGMTPYEGSGTNGSGTSAPQAGTTVHERAGLWVGWAKIDRVSFPEGASKGLNELEDLFPTSSEIQLRLIIHVDAKGKARLLPQATLMWEEGVRDEKTGETLQAGEYVIVTCRSPSFLSGFSGASIRNGQQVGRRISSAAFPFVDPIEMSGTGFGGNLACTLTIGYDHPLNPFKHKYHPNHDNLDHGFQPLGQAGMESYEIARNITLSFTANDPEDLKLAGWGDNQVGGTYQESFMGIHNKTLYVGGTFRLHQVARVPVLNGGRACPQ